MAGAADILIIVGVIAVPVIAYTTDFAGFRTWINTAAAQGQGPNRCWPVGDGRCACSCHGGQSTILGPARGCDDCAAICNTGQAPDPPLGQQKCPKSGGISPGTGGTSPAPPNRCWPVGDGRCACSCHGGQSTILGPARGCDDCAAICNTGQAPSPPLGRQKCPKSGAGTGAAFAQSFATRSFATYPLKGLTVA